MQPTAFDGRVSLARFLASLSCVLARPALAAALLSAASAAGAQAPRGPTREEIERPPPSPVAPPPRIEIEGGLERAPCVLDNPEFAGIRFTLRDVAFDGLGGVDPAALKPAYSGLVGQEQPVSAVCSIRDLVSAKLSELGYIASVQVPEQSLAEGTLRLDVVMARLVQVRVRGDAGRGERQIAAYLNRLTEQPVLNRYDAERYLLLASDLPGYSVRLALRPAGTKPGEVIGEVTVLRLVAAIDANIQNYGSKELGRAGLLARGQLFGLTGLGDVTTASLFVTEDPREQKTLSLGHDFRLGPEGLTVSTGFSYTWATPDSPGRDTIDARTLLAGLSLSYPFVRRQSHTLRGTAGFDFVNQTVSDFGDAITRDRLRVLYARLSLDSASMDFSRTGYSPAEPVWRAGGTLEVRKGVDIFNATERCNTTCQATHDVVPSRPLADPTAALVRALLYGEYRPVPAATIAATVRGQYAAHSLMTFEQFAGGNYTVGRGYDPGAILGDRGWGFSTELRLGSLIPKNAHKLAAQPYGFLDYARVSNEEKAFLPRGQRSLTSVGGGVRASYRLFNLDLTAAFPLEKTGFADDKPGPRILFSLTRQLWPWGS